MDIEKDITENLRDAGCDEEDIIVIMDCLRNGNRKNAEALIVQCRRKHLDRMHEYQQYIDRLDYLRYRLSKE